MREWALALACCGSAAWGEPAMLRSSDGQWSTDLTWWLFAPVNTSGTSTVAGQGADIDMDFSEALKVLDFTSSLRLEAWNGRFGLLADGNYLALSEEGGTTVGRGPLARGLDADISAEQSWLSLMVGYRLAQGSTAAGQPYAFDLHGGARYNRIHQEIKVSGTSRNRTLGGTETWWEPVVGGRGILAINDAWSFAAGADFAGFGAGGNDLAWSANAAFDWAFSERGALKLGYRYYSIDYETDASDGTFGWEIKQHGPFIGVSFALQ